MGATRRDFLQGLLASAALPSCAKKKNESESVEAKLGSVAPQRRSASAAGYAITIGINEVNASHYAQWYGKLNAAESDANAMQRLLIASGFQMSAPLRAKHANRANVIASISQLATKAKADDLVCVYYAGHGGTVYDASRDEMQGRDQTWCLYDAQLIDDEIYNLCAQFVAGTRVIFLSDSCKSGSMLMQAMLKSAIGFPETPKKIGNQVSNIISDEPAARDLSRSMPDDVAMMTRLQNTTYYNDVVANARASTATLQTRCELIAASNSMQDAYEDKKHGYFTGALLNACGNACQHTYAELLAAIRRDVARKSYQYPTRFSIGPAATWFESDIALLI